MSYLTTGNQYLTVNQQDIAYRELSKGKSDLPLVMLVHLAATMDNWDPKLIDLLAAEQHVILLDLPGVGASQGKVAKTIPGMAEQAIDIIKALGYEKINLLGLSMGGMVAQEVVRAQADLVNRLILVGTGPRAGLGIDQVTKTTFNYMFKAGLEGVDPKRFIFYNHDEEGKRDAEEVLNRLTSRSKAYADKDMAVPSFLQQLRAIKRWGKAEADDLAFISQPTLIVNGDKDMMVATENSYDMHRKIANSQLIIYPNAGHGSLFQYADQFAKDLLDFLAD
ncbi:alpha/beta fold hydrolase [Streptococcus cuniculipharyngis]|uniref:Alpha/beta hydrolase n=1 Tax=Streptococcus cuniculipharyngis TaxID=1562651 RepID=A0A5C5S9R6_9STRE|nr:alpha/beta hydrolase [Streptococcus cuniculipharyngis]TWS96193.1 alpha/beta hydrolase [Streptococcus cuniculipharyngis]